MAGNPMRGGFQTCASCGSKIDPTRDKCPRCRARIEKPDPAAEARQSRRIAKWTAGMVGGFAMILTALWLTSDSKAAGGNVAASQPRDPLAGRRTPAAAPGPSEKPAAPERPFMDPSGSAAVAYSSGNYNAALQQYDLALERNPDDAESLSNKGQVLVRLGKAEEALPYFEKAISLIPNRWAYQFNLARALSMLGRWDESIEHYTAAQQLFPNDYATTFNLGLALHKKGDDAAAVQEYLKAIELAPTDASFRFALALSYERLRRNSDAITAYEEYLRLAPAAGDAERVRARIAELSGAPASPAASPGGVDSSR